jgi:hypothetical protein
VAVSEALNLGELQRYLSRVGDRWPIQVALLGGARVDDLRGAPRQRERGNEYVLVSPAFDGMPWLERVYHAGALWDGMEMGDGVDVHCYTPLEFDRKRTTMPAVRNVVARGMLLYEDVAVNGEPSGPAPGADRGGL